MRWHKFALALLFFWLPQSLATPSNPVLLIDGSENGKRLNDAYTVFHDPEAALTLQQVQAKNRAGQFYRLQTRDSSGLLPGAMWSYFVLENSQNTDLAVELEYVDHQARFMQVYYREVSANSDWQTLSLSLDNPFSQRPRLHPRFVAPVTLEGNAIVEFYVRYEGTDILFSYPNLRLWAPQHIERALLNEIIAMGIFTGCLLIMAIVALVTGVSINDKAFTLYGIYILAVIYAWFTITGFTHMFIVTEGFKTNLMSIGGGLAFFFGVWFSRSFLKTPLYLKKIDILLQLMMLNAIVLLVSGIFEVYAIAIPSISLGMLMYPIIIIAGIMRARQGDKEAIVFTFAWMLLVVGIFMQILRDLGYVPHNFFTYYLPVYAKFIEMTTILFAMGSRVRRLRRRKQIIEKRYTANLLRSRQELESLVAERTQQLEAEKQKAENEARVDALTNVYNRRYFFNCAAKTMALANPSHIPMSLLMFDIDHFKAINDKHGHAGGDTALKAFSYLVASNIREEDVFGRLGGEEFALLLCNNSHESALQTAERLKNEIANLQIPFEGETLHITTSIGVAQVQTDESLEHNLKLADDALYQAKNTGRNQVVFAH